MATPQVTGPALIYVSVGGSLAAKQALFLGTDENTPRIRFNKEYVPLMNSLGGTKIPSDMTYQGENAFVQTTLTRWNETPYGRMQAAPFFTGTRGTALFGDLGALMISEGASYRLWIKFPYATKAAFISAGMPLGYRFLHAWLEEDDLGNLNTEGRKITLTWRCEREFNARTLAWTLYDTNMTGLPAVD